MTIESKKGSPYICGVRTPRYFAKMLGRRVWDVGFRGNMLAPKNPNPDPLKATATVPSPNQLEPPNVARLQQDNSPHARSVASKHCLLRCLTKVQPCNAPSTQESYTLPKSCATTASKLLPTNSRNSRSKP